MWISINKLWKWSLKVQSWVVMWISNPFQLGCLLFIFLGWSLWLEPLILCWIEVVKADTLVLFLILVGKLLVFVHWVWCWLQVSHIYSLYYVEICSLYSHFAECFFFIRNGAAPYQMLFLHLLIWSCDFCISFCLCHVLRLLIWEYCTILASLGWIPLDHGVWSF